MDVALAKWIIAHTRQIIITFPVEFLNSNSTPKLRLFQQVHFQNFDDPESSKPGLLKSVLSTHLQAIWKTELSASLLPVVMVINEDLGFLAQLIDQRSFNTPLIMVSSLRHDLHLKNAVAAYRHHGGVCEVVMRPVGPSRLETALSNVSNRMQALIHGDVVLAAPPPVVSSHGFSRCLVVEDNPILRGILCVPFSFGSCMYSSTFYRTRWLQSRVCCLQYQRR